MTFFDRCDLKTCQQSKESTCVSEELTILVLFPEINVDISFFSETPPPPAPKIKKEKTNRSKHKNKFYK